MSAFDNAHKALDDLTPDQLRAALICVWVEDPDRFYAVVKASTVKAAATEVPE